MKTTHSQKLWCGLRTPPPPLAPRGVALHTPLTLIEILVEGRLRERASCADDGGEDRAPRATVGGNTLALQPGIVVSVEPGNYIPGEFSVRLEDDMVITESGAELMMPQSPSLEQPFAAA